MKTRIEPNEFVPQSPQDLLGPASKLAAAVTALSRWLVKRWKLPRSAADWIALSSCGNVREALLQAASFLQFGILPEEKKNAAREAKCANRVAVANKYWEEVRAGLRPAPGMAVAQ